MNILINLLITLLLIILLFNILELIKTVFIIKEYKKHLKYNLDMQWNKLDEMYTNFTKKEITEKRKKYYKNGWNEPIKLRK